MSDKIPYCPTCNARAITATGEDIYPHRPDLYAKKFWRCPIKEHDAYVGCHPGTNHPLGRLATAETRALKLAAHHAFDPLWKQGYMSRGNAYGWLAEKLGIPRGCCHMGSMSDDNLRRVVSICKEYKP